jgi:dihydroorotate dehydrogenase
MRIFVAIQAQVLKNTFHHPPNMGLGYSIIAKPLLAIQDSEKAHSRALKLLRMMVSNPITRSSVSLMYKPSKQIPTTIFGLHFKNPFGIAAGMDKRAEALRGWESLGLGFMEIGGITMLEQLGNPKPRMFRAGKSKALVNRMGFNNPGSENIAIQLNRHFSKHGQPKIPLWINLGKSKLTKLEDAAADYATTMQRLWEYADVFVINVSSPNTPNLRELQKDDDLKEIIESCKIVNESESKLHGIPLKPLLVKISPDLDDDQLVAIVNTARSNGCNGIIASNTTTSRPSEINAKERGLFDQTGGMSGLPVQHKSTEMISKIYKMTNGEFPIVGVGGIMSGEDAWQKICAGASLIQAYSGFVFEGASLTKQVVNGIDKKMRQNGYSTLDQAIGSSHRGG